MRAPSTLLHPALCTGHCAPGRGVIYQILAPQGARTHTRGNQSRALFTFVEYTAMPPFHP